MSNPFVAEIRMFAGNFPPSGWATCDGQLLPISQNTALFSLLGTQYGGNGTSTFGLPNLQGSAPMHQGQGPGLTDRFIGESGGEPNVTLPTSGMPNHGHFIQSHTAHLGSIPSPGPTLGIAKSAGGSAFSSSAPNVQLNFQSLGVVGSSFPHNNMQPYLCVTFIIAMQGVFPVRS